MVINMKNEIIEMAKELGAKIQKSKEFLDFKFFKEKMDSNEELSSMRKDFNNIKEDLNKEISKENSDKNKIKDLSNKLRDMYEKINETKVVCEYELAKKNLDLLVLNINNIINESAHGSFSESLLNSCNGSCSTCDGCC